MDKQQIKARFFGAHIGCGVSATNAFGNGEYILSGVSTLNEGALMVFTEDGGSFSTDITDCKLVLRPLSSITDEELTILSKIIFPAHAKGKTGEMLAAGIRSGKLNERWMMKYTASSIDYLRSINICVPFMGLDPIGEGWAILEEKIPANAPQEAKEEEKI